MPSLFLSCQPVIGRAHHPNIGYPCTTRVSTLICCGVPPRSSSLFLFVDALSVTSQPNARRLSTCAFPRNSRPSFIVAPRLRRTVVPASLFWPPTPADGGTIALISASCVFL